MVVNQVALIELLNQLIAHWEDEVVEFKRGEDGFSSSNLGKYVSALANEANLRGKDSAWLVFGVDDKTRSVVGTSYKETPDYLQADKVQVLNGTGSFTFRDIYELQHNDSRARAPFQDGEDIQTRVKRLEAIRAKAREVERIKALLAREKQYNKRVETNAELRTANQELAALKSTDVVRVNALSAAMNK